MKTRPGVAVYVPPGLPSGTPAEWDPGIHSLADLAAVVTSILTPPSIRAWINAADGTEQIWYLIAGVPPLGVPGILPPNDYNPELPLFWAKASS
jgi:hypothetical protein